MNTTQWSKLLEDAVNIEGLLSKCYSTFHNYSIGNQTAGNVSDEQSEESL